MQEEFSLIEGPRDRAALFASSRNTIKLSYPGLDDLLRIDELDLIYPSEERNAREQLFLDSGKYKMLPQHMKGIHLPSLYSLELLI
jgi:hypothetical protein